MARHGMHGRHRASVIRRLIPVSAPAAEATEQEYLVQDGDTFSSIAREHQIPTAKLLAMNGLSWSSGIAAGQRLNVPAGITPAATAPAHTDITRHCIAEGETVTAIATQYGVTRRAILSANGLHPSSLIFIGQILVIPGVSIDTRATAAIRVG